ncbi:hypothetical protein [Nonomuraea sp. NPDC050310]|uniref:hypothetical protein n=1 Tax=Nonomuraea sp. NPDC050310 TaxID=3154935 RepID=UPI0034026F42
MTVTIPLVVLIAAFVFVAVRYLRMRVWHAVAAALLGFLLATTTVAPHIQRALDASLSWLTSR